MKMIVHLERDKYKDYEIHFRYTSEAYYDVRMENGESEFNIAFVKTPFEKSISKTFTDKLFEPHWDKPEAYGIFDKERLIAVLEVTPELWNNRLRITNLWVDEPYRRKGYCILSILGI